MKGLSSIVASVRAKNMMLDMKTLRTALLLSALLIGSTAANAAPQKPEGCVDLTGSYQQMFFGRWIMKLWVTQDGCQSYSARYVMPTGGETFRNFTLDGVTRAIGGDPETDSVYYEWSTIDEGGIRMGGHTLRENVLFSSWKGSLTLDAKGNFVDWMEEFDRNGKSMGPVRQVFERW